MFYFQVKIVFNINITEISARVFSLNENLLRKERRKRFYAYYTLTTSSSHLHSQDIALCFNILFNTFFVNILQLFKNNEQFPVSYVVTFLHFLI